MGSLGTGQVSGLAFLDTAGVTINCNALSATGVNKIALSSAGLGLNWAGTNGLSAKAYIAVPVGEIDPALGVTNVPRTWIEVVSSF